MTLLVDTNVWLDKYIPDRPHAQASMAVLAHSVREEVELLYPLRAVNDVFWQVARDRKTWVVKEYGHISEAHAHAINTDAWECIDNMCEVATAVGADASDVWYARHLREVHPDFEDDLVLAAARRAKVDYLVTSDRQLIQKATVAALTPEDMLKVLKAPRG